MCTHQYLLDQLMIRVSSEEVIVKRRPQVGIVAISVDTSIHQAYLCLYSMIRFQRVYSFSDGKSYRR
jgi:hypothetical protein